MDHLWAPWRIEYVKKANDEGCIFCEKPGLGDDTENLILHRGRFNFIILNAYPYNPGHLMVAPYRHISDPGLLEEDEVREHAAMVVLATSLLRKALHPEGFNLGMNLGRVAGAGFEGHLHTHIVPRWAGDNNFMPVIADTRVVNEAIAETYDHLRGVLSKMQKAS